MTIQQANQYFAALPDGFADPEQLGALLPASVQQVQFVGVAALPVKRRWRVCWRPSCRRRASAPVRTTLGASRLHPASG